ncbi:MAG TPA: hypothetical protein VGO58_19385 [Chitinophagaceae bacterium]|jgi:hypothetical protein|nr:hypothetical protein [Chitinophagaceae bacterium]
MPLSLRAQSKLGIENYYYSGKPGSNSVVPVVHFETKNSFRGELRYNYEDANTLSFFTGKTIAAGKAVQYSISPMVGLSTGTFTGLSFATNIEIEWKSIYFSSENQYSMAMKSGYDNFFFSWSELGYDLSDHFFGGLAVQYTRSGGSNKIEPGFVGGFYLGDLTVPLYAFSPFGPGKYFVVGVIYECNFKKRIK